MMDRNEGSNHELSPEDRRILDALVEAGFDPAGLEAQAPEAKARADRMMELLGLLNDYPVDDGDDMLVHATLAAVDRAEEARHERLSMAVVDDTAGGRGFRLPDFISVAAVLLIIAGLAWPILTNIHRNSLDVSCANNLRQVGYAFSHYAQANAGALPVAIAGSNMSWERLANVINLGPLVDGQYCDHSHLNCPCAGKTTDGSYSYQWQSPGKRPTWGAGAASSVILGDRNPLIDAYRSGKPVPAWTSSTNHGGRGQNILASDGATLWLRSEPIMPNTDNIWLPEGKDELEPGAEPASSQDAFLVH